MLLSNIGLDGGLVELGSLTSLGFPIILGRKKFKNHLKVEWVADDGEIPAKFDARALRHRATKYKSSVQSQSVQSVQNTMRY